MRFSAPKGTRDILPGEIAGWQYAEKVFGEICSRYGYQEIRIPTFEQTDLFQRGVGDTTDVVQKEMYTFLDKGGRSMSLRPEGTAGVVRAYLENGMASWPSPVRLFYNITAFRYENVQKGRYREFHQFGCEVFGSAGPAVDAELISLLQLYFETLGLKRTSLRINSIGCPACRGTYQTMLQDYLRPHLASLCGNCRDRFDKNPLRIIDCKEERCRTFTQDAPAQLDHLCPDCQAHFDGLCANLKALGLEYAIDRRIVRGLDYYTRTVFEFVSENVGSQGTICGGGRYDGLVEQCGGKPTPGVGIGMGLERLLLARQKSGVVFGAGQRRGVLVLAMGDEAWAEALKLCYELRAAGLRAEVDYRRRSFKAQMRFADSEQLQYALILGEDELARNVAGLKNLETGEQVEVARAELLSRLG